MGRRIGILNRSMDESFVNKSFQWKCNFASWSLINNDQWIIKLNYHLWLNKYMNIMNSTRRLEDLNLIRYIWKINQKKAFLCWFFFFFFRWSLIKNRSILSQKLWNSLEMGLASYVVIEIELLNLNCFCFFVCFRRLFSQMLFILYQLRNIHWKKQENKTVPTVIGLRCDFKLYLFEIIVFADCARIAMSCIQIECYSYDYIDVF